MDITKTILKFVLQSEDYPTTEVNRSLHNKYRGYIDIEYMNCTTSVGLSARGDRRYDITYIAFVNYEQTVKQGIYPVVLYFRKIKKLIFAYGVSATNESDITWDWNKINIQPPQKLSDLFAVQGWEKYDKYFDSFAFSHYDLSDFITKYKDRDITDNSTDLELNSFDFQHDIDILIEQFHIMFGGIENKKGNKMQGSDSQTNITRNHVPEQTIYFGSPGTGKSYSIKNELLEKGIDEEKKINIDRLFRTTFHPDADYSSFVGCYKPVCNPTKVKIKGITQLKAEAQALMNEITQKPGAKVEMLSTFMADNAEPLLKAEAEGNSWKSILDQVFSKGYINNDSYLHSLCKIVAEINDKQTTSISYKFTPQVFTLAYEKAWNLLNSPDKSADEKQVYLVIEEINRGNCAQVFGDLFQLLDRKNDGYSEYQVKADTDLYNYLISLEGWSKDHHGILNGNLCLPPNLNIIATMNTSDQSLFPMDSAFKRRWEWKYIPTTAPVGEESDITIDAGDKEYSWKLFLEKINEMILRATNSEDKQLGFWFVKADKSTKQIPTSTFVSKVVFYLWNDVFKDMGAKGTNPFTISYEGKNEIMSFNSFFEIKPDGKIAENIGVLHSFLKNVGLEPK